MCYPFFCIRNWIKIAYIYIERERDYTLMDKKNQELMEDFEKKASLTDTEAMETEAAASSSKSSNTLLLLRRFLEIQERRAQAYAKLKQYFLSFPLISFPPPSEKHFIWAFDIISECKAGKDYLGQLCLWILFEKFSSFLGFNWLVSMNSGAKKRLNF